MNYINNNRYFIHILNRVFDKKNKTGFLIRNTFFIYIKMSRNQRSGNAIDINLVSNNIKTKVYELESRHGSVNELRMYKNNSIGGYFGENNIFRFLGQNNKNDVEINKFYTKKTKNNHLGGSPKKKVSLKTAVGMLRKYYDEIYGND